MNGYYYNNTQAQQINTNYSVNPNPLKVNYGQTYQSYNNNLGYQNNNMENQRNLYNNKSVQQQVPRFYSQMPSNPKPVQTYSQNNNKPVHNNATYNSTFKQNLGQINYTQPQKTNKNKYEDMLNNIVPSVDFLKESRVDKNYSLQKEDNSKRNNIQYNSNTKPGKSALIRRRKQRTDKLNRPKTVSFNDDETVFEVENWKLYNVDSAKEQKRKRKNGDFCNIF